MQLQHLHEIAQTGAIVKPADFTFVAREGTLGAYAWGHKISTRHFCTNCGIHVFGRGHLDVLGGDYVSVNLNCLDEVDVNLLPIHHWDGRHDNWQARTAPLSLAPSSRQLIAPLAKRGGRGERATIPPPQTKTNLPASATRQVSAAKMLFLTMA